MVLSVAESRNEATKPAPADRKLLRDAAEALMCWLPKHFSSGLQFFQLLIRMFPVAKEEVFNFHLGSGRHALAL